MKTFCPAGLAICATLCTGFIPAAHAEFKCDGRPLARVDAAGCAHASQGPDSLRRFVKRTEAIYGVRMRDYARFVGDDEPKRRQDAPARITYVNPAHVQRDTAK